MNSNVKQIRKPVLHKEIANIDKPINDDYNKFHVALQSAFEKEEGDVYLRQTSRGSTTKFWNRLGIALVVFSCFGGLSLLILVSASK